jgi:hypothetical protein
MFERITLIGRDVHTRFDAAFRGTFGSLAAVKSKACLLRSGPP